MIFDWILFFNVLIADLALELPLIAFIVLGINPKMAASKTKDVLLQDDQFREDLVSMLTYDLFKPIKWTDKEGKTSEMMPIEIISSYLLTGMKQWINGKQSEMTQELEKNAEEAIALDPTNPMQAFLLQQIPKKYRPYIQLAANLFLQQKP